MNKIYVGNLPYDCTEADLRSTFDPCGSIETADVIFDRYTGKSKGFGFVALDKGGKDLRLTSQQMKLVFHGDKIRVRLLNKKLDAEIKNQKDLSKKIIKEFFFFATSNDNFSLFFHLVFLRQIDHVLAFLQPCSS